MKKLISIVGLLIYIAGIAIAPSAMAAQMNIHHKEGNMSFQSCDTQINNKEVQKKVTCKTCCDLCDINLPDNNKSIVLQKRSDTSKKEIYKKIADNFSFISQHNEIPTNNISIEFSQKQGEFHTFLTQKRTLILRL